jgi:predicted nucleic acid-binding protein
LIFVDSNIPMFAVMAREGVDRIMTFDRGFDGLPGIIRLRA